MKYLGGVGKPIFGAQTVWGVWSADRMDALGISGGRRYVLLVLIVGEAIQASYAVRINYRVGRCRL